VAVRVEGSKVPGGVDARGYDEAGVVESVVAGGESADPLLGGG
jgi:hypothetical protein